jgi:mono/diheme cytochrome c family protein
MTRRARNRLLVAGLILAAVLVAAGPRGGTSSRPPRRVDPSMDVQPRAEAQAASAFFYDGGVLRPPVAGTVARGALRDDGPLWTGMAREGGFASTNALAVDAALRERGRRRYEIYCAPCHDRNGDGKGILAERAQVRTPSFHDERLRRAPDGYFFIVMTMGFGLMPSYAYPIPPEDRWAIVAHVRELQARRSARDAERGASEPCRLMGSGYFWE